MIVSPYKNVDQYSRIKVPPHQLNSDIRNNIKLILKKNLEKKCNKNGFIEEIFKVIDFEDGELYPENLSGSVMFDIKFHCRLCLPIENTIIISKVVIINQELIVATNGPIFIFIPKENIDKNIWKIFDNNLINNKTDKELKINDFVKVTISNKKVNKDDWQIKAIGILNDFASKKEIEKYYGTIIEEILEEKSEENENVNNDDNFII
jgi:DNA-directed RNA polymerase subunit E'/Rpb7